MKIFKYMLHLGHSKIEMPRGAKILEVGLDPQGDMSIWAMVEPGNKTVFREFFVYGTGEEVGHHTNYLGSIVSGMFVWHVFN